MNATITVTLATLIATVRKNREEHIKRHQAAFDGWKQKALESCRDLHGLVENSKPECNFPAYELWRDIHDRPTSHVQDYDRAIALLELHEGVSLALSADDVRKYMQDDWDWSQNFRYSCTKYAS